MPNRLFIYPYKQGSESCKALANSLDIRRIKLYNSTYRPRQGDVIINWGSSSLPNHITNTAEVINSPESVKLCCNKLTFFNWFNNQNFNPEEVAGIPKWTTSKEEVLDNWVVDENSPVVARTKLTGHSGEGISILRSFEEVEQASADVKLFTRYLKKTKEYRLHFAVDEEDSVHMFDLQQKVRDPDREPANWQVRSHQNGFIFVRGDVQLDESVVNKAKKVFLATGLSFGAVDLIIHERKPYILEINTAPALTGETLVKYTELFRTLF